MPVFTWDEAKRRANLRKHGIDFADTRDRYEEHRFLTLGLPWDQVVSVAHTGRDEGIRIISIRKATNRETHFYFSQVTDQALAGSKDHRRRRHTRCRRTTLDTRDVRACSCS